MKRGLFVFMLFVLCASLAGITIPASADPVGDLFNDYVQRAQSQKVTLVISEQPDATGLFKEAYLEAKGVVFEAKGVVFKNNPRIDSVNVNVSSLQLNPPSEWSNSRVDCKGYKSASATVSILESDINAALKDKDFRFENDGKYFIFHNVEVDITTSGVRITGFLKEQDTRNFNSYVAAFLLGAAADDYPVVITSKVKVVDGKEIWLDDPKVDKGNYSDIDSYIERKITQRNTPLLDLGNLDLSRTPITLGKVELKDGSVTISTAALPKAIEGGVKYTHPASSSNENSKIEPVTENNIEVSLETLIKNVAEVMNVSEDAIKFITEKNISEPQEPTQAILTTLSAKNETIISKLNTLTVSEDGYYVFKVTLSDNLYEQIKGVSVKDLRAHAFYDDGEDNPASETSQVRSSFITGLLNTWELLTLSGEKLEFGAREFLMVGLLNAGTPFSVYLTKIILFMLGGCDIGIGIVGFTAIVLSATYFIRRRKH